MGAIKTNVIRVLDKAKIPYVCTEYDVKDGKVDGVSVAEKVGKKVEEVFKTLVVQGKSKNCYVCVIPVAKTLDLKKVSEVTGEKNVEMLPSGDLLKTTGYVHGGCSPIGMKKSFKTFVDSSAKDLEKMTFSAGKIGVQVETMPRALIEIVKAEYGDLTVD